MSNEPLVSIITATYNSEDTIHKAIKSVKYQSYENIEYIIVDGGSKDSTTDIIREEKLIDKYISEQDKGIYDAWNKGIKLSSGNIIGTLNSDDWYEMDAVKRAVKTFKNKEVSLVHGDMVVWGKSRRIWRAEDRCYSHISAPFNHPTCFIKSKVYEELGLYDNTYGTAGDYDFMLRFESSPFESASTGSIMVHFRQGGASSGPPPLEKIFRVLRDNEYNYPRIISGLGIRVIRYISAYTFKKLAGTFYPRKSL